MHIKMVNKCKEHLSNLKAEIDVLVKEIGEIDRFDNPKT